jgi:hypothetical protein
LPLQENAQRVALRRRPLTRRERLPVDAGAHEEGAGVRTQVGQKIDHELPDADEVERLGEDRGRRREVGHLLGPQVDSATW